jgi:hypothetical protein
MTRKDKLTVMIYKALALYVSLYPKERARLKKLVRPTPHPPKVY